MNTEKIKTLEQVFDAIEAIEQAKSIPGLGLQHLNVLEDALLRLWNIEQAIIRKAGEELISSLTNDAQALDALAAQIQQAVAELGNTASAIGKAANIVGALVSILTAALRAGF